MFSFATEPGGAFRIAIKQFAAVVRPGPELAPQVGLHFDLQSEFTCGPIFILSKTRLLCKVSCADGEE